MLQDIEPYVLDNQYCPRPPQDNDYIFIYHNNQVIFGGEVQELQLPKYCDVLMIWQVKLEQLVYLFSVDDIAFYLMLHKVPETNGYSYHIIQAFRDIQPKWMSFAVATATHLGAWYDCNRYCGKCAGKMEQKSDERALFCPKCSLRKYPQISPVIIVGIIDGERILLTKYASGYDRYALVAGFVEIGETLEDAVRREIKEEVGLNVCNIRYYKSQPWAFSQSLLMGFFADVYGDDNVTIDKRELSEATWFHREDIPKGYTTISLTWTMIEAFRNKNI